MRKGPRLFSARSQSPPPKTLADINTPLTPGVNPRRPGSFGLQTPLGPISTTPADRAGSPVGAQSKSASFKLTPLNPIPTSTDSAEKPAQLKFKHYAISSKQSRVTLSPTAYELKTTDRLHIQEQTHTFYWIT